jgi:hypothetical protein
MMMPGFLTSVLGGATSEMPSGLAEERIAEAVGDRVDNCESSDP